METIAKPNGTIGPSFTKAPYSLGKLIEWKPELNRA
jgi:hypothetical protein